MDTSTLPKLFPAALLLAGLSLPCQAAEAPKTIDLPAAETGHFLDVQALLMPRAKKPAVELRYLKPQFFARSARELQMYLLIEPVRRIRATT